MATNANGTGFWYPSLAGFAGIGLGTGLLRFAYTPIVPTLVHADWTSVPEAAWLGSANFWGGFGGMLLSLPISQKLPRQTILVFAMATGVASLFACAWDLGFVWFAFLRFIQGLAGALIMALLPGGVMTNVPASHRTMAGGITIAGMGFAFFPSLLFPLIAHLGPSAEWICCGFMGLICLALAGPFAFRHIRGTTDVQQMNWQRLDPQARGPYTFFIIAYAVAGVSMIPDALFLSDYLVRSLNAAPPVASALFTYFAAGLGIGAGLGGIVAHRFGSLSSIVILAALGLGGNSIILIANSAQLVSVASFFFAIWVGGTVSMASIRTLELVGPNRHPTYWPVMCLAYAIGMGIAATGFAGLTQHGVPTLFFFWMVELFLFLFIVFALFSYRGSGISLVQDG